MVEHKKIIIFRLDADHTIGMGHLYRMMQLGKIFDKSGYLTKFVIKANNVTKKILSINNFDHLCTPKELTESQIIDKVLTHNEPTCWIYDVLDTQEEWISHLKKKLVYTVCIDDRNGVKNGADIVINPIVGCWEANKIEGKKVYNGPQYAIVPEYTNTFRKIRKISPQNNTHLNIGVSMGGSDTHGSTIKIAAALNSVAHLIDCVHFHLGPSFKHYDELDSTLTDCDYNYSKISNPKNLLQELDKMDLVICGGGVTLFELQAIGMPVLAFANELHEKKTISYFKKHNSCIDITLNSSEDNEIARNLIKIFNNIKQLNELSSKAIKIVDVNGANRTFELIVPNNLCK